MTRNSLTLSWEPPIGDDTITGYIIEKKKEHTDEWVRVARTPGKVRTHNVTGLPVGGTFSFRVSAENPAGVSEPAQLPVAVELKGNKGNGIFQTIFFSVPLPVMHEYSATCHCMETWHVLYIKKIQNHRIYNLFLQSLVLQYFYDFCLLIKIHVPNKKILKTDYILKSEIEFKITSM